MQGTNNELSTRNFVLLQILVRLDCTTERSVALCNELCYPDESKDSYKSTIICCLPVLNNVIENAEWRVKSKGLQLMVDVLHKSVTQHLPNPTENRLIQINVTGFGFEASSHPSYLDVRSGGPVDGSCRWIPTVWLLKGDSDDATFAACFGMDALAVHVTVWHGAFLAFICALVPAHGA